MTDHTDAAGTAAAPAKKGKKKLMMIAVPVLLLAVGAGGWFSGIVPKMLGHGEAHGGHDAKPAGHAAAAAPVYFELPDIVANLNTGARRASFIKLKARLELSKPEDQAIVQGALPRILDLFQTYLREMRPEELRGTASTYRLREELIARSNIAGQPAKIVNVLFTEMLVQ